MAKRILLLDESVGVGQHRFLVDGEDFGHGRRVHYLYEFFLALCSCQKTCLEIDHVYIARD